MALDITLADGIRVVVLVPRFDSNNSAAIEAELKPLLENIGEHVLFDCSKMEYLASAGLRVMLSFARTAMKNGGKIAVCSLTPHVKAVFDMAGFSKIFPVYGSRNEALKNLK